MSDITNNEKLQRFEIRQDGELAGFLEYRHDGNDLVLVHTEVDPSFEGKGVGSILVKQVLDDVRASGRKIVPSCEFVASYIERHPEYAGLVA